MSRLWAKLRYGLDVEEVERAAEKIWYMYKNGERGNHIDEVYFYNNLWRVDLYREDVYTQYRLISQIGVISGSFGLYMREHDLRNKLVRWYMDHGK